MAVLALGAPAAAQPRQAAASGASPADPAARPHWLAKDYLAPADVDFRVANVISEGVRLHAEIFIAKGNLGRALPTVIMAHGWGGVAASFRPDAVELARAGYAVITFDYRGWGESDSRVLLTGPEPVSFEDNVFEAKVKAIRGYVDPFEQAEDWFNVIDWAMGQPFVDKARVGLRGSSYSGGLVVYVAGRDPRIKAIVSQVGGIQARPTPDQMAHMPERAPQFVAAAHARGTEMAEGVLGYPPPFEKALGNLIGAPVGDKMLRWWPNEEAPYVHAAALFILAGNEELVDNKTNGELANQRVPGPKKLVIIPGIKHYGIYNEAREQAIRLAISWFDQNLKP